METCEYKLDRDEFFGWILWQREHGKEWRQLYGFTEEPQLDIDFVMPSFFFEQHPASEHNVFRKISIFTKNSQIGLVDDELQVYQNARVDQRNCKAQKKSVKRFRLFLE